MDGKDGLKRSFIDFVSTSKVINDFTATPAKTASFKNQLLGNISSPEMEVLWIVTSTFIIFTMISGFTLLESGFTQRKNEVNVHIKNILAVVLSGISFWLVGYGFVHGKNEGTNTMSGLGSFLLQFNVDADSQVFAKFLIQLPFAITSTHILSGAVSERVNLKAFMVYAMLNTAFIYVFPAHWMWSSSGWLSKFGAFDFAGAGVVHLSGGAAAFTGALLLGPRYGRFGVKKREFKMNKPANIILGTVMLWWSWYGLNCISAIGFNASMWKLVARIAVVTMNGAMAGGIASITISAVNSCKKGYFYIDIGMLVFGVLGGLVSTTGVASVCRPWEGLIIGFVGGVVANGVISLLEYLHIDDPVGAVGVHWGAGLWSMISVGLFADVDPQVGLNIRWNGVFRGGDGYLLGAQLLASLAITIWTAGLSSILFALLQFTIGFRAPLKEEITGFDALEHGINNEDDEDERESPSTAGHVSKPMTYERNLFKRKENHNESGEDKEAV